MNIETITCSMCGSTFDPSEHAACQSCPLHKGCQLVCCPVCGYETVDPGKSRLARLVARWLPTDATDERGTRVRSSHRSGSK